MSSDPAPHDHVGDTIQAVLRLHEDHRRSASRTDRTVARLTAALAHPAFIAATLALVAAWAAVNLAEPLLGRRAFDPEPFNLLQGMLTLVALAASLLILATQRRDDRIGAEREQLTLQLALLTDRKLAKVIALVEELRRDHPDLLDRHDAEAVEMARPADAQAMIEHARGVLAEPTEPTPGEDGGRESAA